MEIHLFLCVFCEFQGIAQGGAGHPFGVLFSALWERLGTFGSSVRSFLCAAPPVLTAPSEPRPAVEVKFACREMRNVMRTVLGDGGRHMLVKLDWGVAATGKLRKNMGGIHIEGVWSPARLFIKRPFCLQAPPIPQGVQYFPPKYLNMMPK